MQIAVGGCLAQKDRGEIVRRAPWVDVVFGTHNIGSLPALLDRARHNEEAQVEILESLEVFPSTLPTKRESAYAGWVSISVGLQQHLHVLHRAEPARQGEGPPSRRDPGRDRGAGRRGSPRGDPAGPEREHLRRGVRRPPGVRQAAALLRRDRRARAGPLHQPAPGRVHRRRHRRDGRDAQRDAEPAHAAAERLGPRAQGDAPLVPLAPVPGHHRLGAGPDPGRRDHHRHHRRLPRRDRGGLPGRPWTSSARPGSPARSPSSTPSDPARRRPTCRTSCRRPSCRSATSGWSPCRTRSPGPRTEPRRGACSRCWSPRARAARTRRPTGCPDGPRTTGWCTSPSRSTRWTAGDVPRPGDVVQVEVTYGAPHHLVADAALHGGPYAVRRTRAGDAWQARQDGAAGEPAGRRARACPRSGRPQPLRWSRAAGEPGTGRRARRRGRRGHGDRQVRPRGRARAQRSTARWSTPTPCSSTAAWTSAPRSSPPAQRDGVPHHLLDVLDVDQEATLAGYQRDVDAGWSSVLGARPGARRGRRLRALRAGRARPCWRSRPPTRGVRAELEAEAEQLGGPTPCTRGSPGSTRPRPARILPGNVRRVVRALEVVELTGRPFSATLPEPAYRRPTVQLGPARTAPGAGRADRRPGAPMWDDGLLAEVQRPGAAGPARGPDRGPGGGLRAGARRSWTDGWTRRRRRPRRPG